MKRLFLFVILVLGCTSLYGQKMPSDSYNELKNNYDASSYVHADFDPYPAFWCGVGSLVVPGLGQFITNEPRRGVKFLVGSLGLGLLGELSGTVFATMVIASEAADEFPDDDLVFTKADEVATVTSGIVMIACTAANLGLSIWSALDASRIAKVKNMYWQDSAGRQSLGAVVYPSLNAVRTPSGLKPAAGMTLAVYF